MRKVFPDINNCSGKQCSGLCDALFGCQLGSICHYLSAKMEGTLVRDLYFEEGISTSNLDSEVGRHTFNLIDMKGVTDLWSWEKTHLSLIWNLRQEGLALIISVCSTGGRLCENVGGGGFVLCLLALALLADPFFVIRASSFKSPVYTEDRPGHPALWHVQLLDSWTSFLVG